MSASDSDLRERSRRLRREQTDAEGRLWRHLRGRRLAGAKFRRQVPIGPYIVDFCCRELALVVEVDGGQHTDAGDYDARRTRELEARGFRVLRFWNHEVLGETDAVLEQIRRATSSPGMPPETLAQEK